MKNEPIDWLKNYNLLIFDEIDSTNDEAKRLALAGVKGDFVIWAATQTNGRGRNLKPWESSFGNLFTSILLGSNDNIAFAADISLMVAVVIGEILTNLLPSQVKISYKWPNDVLVEGKKISGILLESVNIGNQNKGIIIGVGININSAPALLQEQRYEATCMSAHGAANISTSVLINEYMKSFDFFLNAYKKYGIRPIKEIWLQKCHDLGKKVTIKIGDQEITGIFSDMTENAAIKLTLPNGEEKLITSGEIFYKNGKIYGCKQT